MSEQQSIGGSVPSGTPKKACRSSQKTAELLNISSRKIERMRAILDCEDQTFRKAVEDGSMTMNSAYEAIQARKREQKHMENMSPEDIGDWRRDELMKSLETTVKKHLAQEARQYPWIGYTSDSKWEFCQEFSQKLLDMFDNMLPTVRDY